MKSGLASMTMALDALIACGIKLKGDVILEYTMDEELSGNGTLACVMRGYQADAGICCETSSLHVQPGCIGRIWFEISVQGKPAGIQRRFEGVNAIEKGYEIVRAVANLEQIRINELKHPLYPDNRSSIPCMVTMFDSGSFPSAFPDTCLLQGSIASLPGEETEEVRLFRRDEIPWGRIAFRAVEFCLERYFEPGASGTASGEVHLGSYDPGIDGSWTLHEAGEIE